MSLSFAFCCLLGAFSGVRAQQSINVVTTATPFLRISPDARAGAMGEAGVSTSADVNSQFYNLAKYSFSKNKSGIGATYIPWMKDLGLKDVYLASLAGYYKLDEQQTLSASFRYFSLGNIQFSDNNGHLIGQGSPREMGADLGYSRKLSDHLALGVALRFIHSNLGAKSSTAAASYKSGQAVAGDIGLYYTSAGDNKNGWSAGLALTNLGSRISYNTDGSQKAFLPANAALGIGYTWHFDESNKLSANAELNKLLVPDMPVNSAEYQDKGIVSSWFSSFGNKATAYSFGGEYTYNEQFSLRAGYYTDSRNMGKQNYFTMGVGVNYSNFGLNFAYLIPSGNGVTRNPLSNTLRFGVAYNIGQ